MPTLQVRKQQLVREAIWDAAIELFAKQGFDETTVDDIASAAGVSRRSFFRYFASKNDLMAQGVVDFAATLKDAIESCPRAYPVSRVFRETVLSVARQSSAEPRTRKLMEIAAKFPAAREAQYSRTAELQDAVAEAYARRLKRAPAKDITPAVLAGLTLAVLSITFRAWFQSGQEEISRTAEQVLSTVERLMSDDTGRVRRPAASRS